MITTTPSIYLDYAAATPTDARVVKAMQPYWSDIFANPSSLHTPGQEAREAVENARLSIANQLGCLPEEIIFTASGTESLQLALRGVALADADKNHIITTQVEHPAVLATCEQLASEGIEVTYLPVDKDGMVNPADVASAITDKTCLVSVMYANNEVGTIEPITEIARITGKHHIPFHVDACQAAGSCGINVDRLGIDLLTLNGSKIYGPKGSGLLYVRQGIDIIPTMSGGGQERGLRGGTENVPAIVGLASALQIAQEMRASEVARLTKLRDYMIAELHAIKDCTLNGHESHRLPHIVHASFKGLDGQSLVGWLDQAGISISSGSACAEATPDPSHVLLAMGRTYEEAFCGVRFSLGRSTTEDEVNAVVEAVRRVVKGGS